MNSIDNLWEFDIRRETDISPKRVMEAQANYLMQMSEGAIQVHVESSPGKGVRSETYVHEFKVGMRDPLQFEYKLFEVRQPIDIYPLQVWSEPSQVEAECANLEEFKTAVKTILNAESTQTRLRALYSQAAGSSANSRPSHDELPTGESLDAESGASDASSSPESPPAQETDSDTGSEPQIAEESVAGQGASDSDMLGTGYDESETVSGDMTLAELDSRFKSDLKSSGYSTVGEFMRAELGSGAHIGARIERRGTTLEIEETSGKHVLKVNVIRNP